MVSLTCTTQSTGGVTLVAARLTGDEVTHRVRVANRLDGPVWPPRREGVPESGWEDDEYAAVVSAGETVAVGYASPASPDDPPMEIVEREPANDDGEGTETTPSDAVRELGDPSPPRAADPRTLCDAVAAVERSYGAVVVDCPAGLRADAGLPLVAATACVLVTTPAEAALSDAMRARELAREFDAGLVRVALNRAGPDPPTDRVADLFGAPVVPIPTSESVERAQTAGQPVRSLAPASPARAGFAELARAVRSCTA